MNKVILMGRLGKNPEIRYSQAANPTAVTRYSLAVNRGYKQSGQTDVDFINIVTFGKRAEFANKYFKKGLMVSIVGRLSVRSWTDNGGEKRWSTEVIADEQFFAENKASVQSRQNHEPEPSPVHNPTQQFYPINDDLDDDLPF